MPEPFLSETEELTIGIENFIFHVVHHGGPEPILFDEVPLGEYEGFFLDLIRATLKGNRFIFAEHSTTKQLLKEVVDEPGRFVPISKQLAANFHYEQDKRIKPGALIVVGLNAGDQKFYSMIKYDHERVLTYREEGTRAILQEIANTFSKSREALHKSAVVRLDRGEGELVVIDQTVRADISDFFRTFLGAKRMLSNAQLTELVEKVIVETAKAHKDTLPNSITCRIREIAFNVIQNNDTFESEKVCAQVFGADGGEKVQKTFDRAVKRLGLEGEKFEYDKNALRKPRKRKLHTKEGVQIQYGEDAKETVAINEIDANKTIITITTAKLTEC